MPDDNLNMLQRLRLDRGLTQQQAAHAAGVDAITVSRAERGKNISADTAKKLAALYGVTIDTILGASNVSPPDGAAEVKSA